MAILRPSYEELVARFESTLREMTGINQFGESSVAGAIARILAVEISHLYDLVEAIERQNNIATATGQALDRLGNLFGVYRKPAQPATSVGSSVGVVFTNRGTATVTVPAGTLVWSGKNPFRRYRTLDQIEVPAGESRSVHVVAEEASSVYHVAARELDTHGLDVTTLTVTNPLPITNAQPVEDDESYRSRIIGSFLRRYFGSESYIRDALLELTGVQQVEIWSGSRGPGTVDILVVPSTIPPGADLVESVREVVRSSVVPGIDWRVRWPRVLAADVNIRLQWKQAPDRSVYGTIVDGVRSVIDTTPISTADSSAVISVSEIHYMVMSASPQILSADVLLLVDGERVTDTYTVPPLCVVRSRRVEVL
jgi:uncharacterized phage protein gp47/JayE